MAEDRRDVLVVGAGPAGSVAALVLARNGVRVTIVDKAGFPRDKACGDLVGPRGVRLLQDLGIATPGAAEVTSLRVVGPTGRSVIHRRHIGRGYADHGIVLPRVRFDALLLDAAREAGAEFRRASATVPVPGRDGIDGFELSDRRSIRADVVVGADGALSTVGRAAGLVRPQAALWGLAVRLYVEATVDRPTIVMWEPEPWRGLPGYGWLFPGPDGRANVGLGIGALHDRRRAAAANDLVDSFVAHLRQQGMLRASPDPGSRRGGWVRVGMVGAAPARSRVLLVGDAAGLVNPLQGEGISEAMASGRAAADAILAQPAEPAPVYRRFLADTYAGFHGANAAVHAALLPRSRVVALAGRILTAPGLSRAIASGWAVYWNDLLRGARPSWARTVARAGRGVVDLATRHSRIRRSVREAATGTGAEVADVSRPGGLEGAVPGLELDGLAPSRRSILTTAGTLQTTLGDVFDEPIDVAVTQQVERAAGIHRVAVLRGRHTGRAVCRAVSDIWVDDAQIRARVLGQRAGLGRILAVLGRPSRFRLLQVGADDGAFWRRYELAGHGFRFRIREEFPARLYEGGLSAGGAPRGASAALAQGSPTRGE